MTVEANDYFEIEKITEVSVSPKGSHTAFVTRIPRDETSYTTAIHIHSHDDGSVEQYTFDTDQHSEPQWGPDGETLAFVSTRGSADQPQLWVLPVDGGEARQVTKVVGSVSSIAWAPSGDEIAFVQQVSSTEIDNGYDINVPADYERETPDPNVIDRTVYRSKEGYFYDRRKHVYTVTVDDGTVTRITDDEYDFKQPNWGDDQTLFYTAKRTGDTDDNQLHDIIRYDRTTETEETLAQTHARFPSPKATTDGRVAFIDVTDTYPGPQWYLKNIQVYHPDEDRLTTPTANVDRTVSSRSPFTWGPDGDYVYFVTPDEGSVKLLRAHADQEEAEVLIGGQDKHVRTFDVGGDQIGFVQSRWNNINDLYAADLDGSDVTRVTQVNEEYLDEVTINEPEEIWFESGEVEVQGWLLTPDEPPEDGQYPLAVEIHGGPTLMWTTSGTMWHEFQLLAARGYAVFWCNPRGSTGYGEDFTKDLAADWGSGLCYQDLMASVNEVTDYEFIDEENTFVLGGSFGGYMTAWIVTQTDRFKAAAPQRGLYDRIGQFGGKDTYYSAENQIGVPWKNFETYWETSPIAHVENADTPTLIVHGEQDHRVPIHNAEAMYRFLRKEDVETRFLRYPREGHELSRSGEPAHVVDRLERIVRWLDGYSDYHDVPPAIERDDEDLTYPSAIRK